jgi:hypothetical protein
MDMTTKHNNEITENRQVIMNAADDMIEKIKTGELIAQDCPVTHRFTPGCYLREILMVAGTKIIGKIHATEHFNILLTGSVTVITAEGVEHIKAPYTFISKAGVQKVVVIHEDCIWQTVHVTNETDLEKIEKEVIVEGYDQLLIDGLLSQGQGVLV